MFHFLWSTDAPLGRVCLENLARSEFNNLLECDNVDVRPIWVREELGLCGTDIRFGTWREEPIIERFIW